MTLGTLAVATVLALIVVLDIRYLVSQKDCHHNCQNCLGGCKYVQDLQKAHEEIVSEKATSKSQPTQKRT